MSLNKVMHIGRLARNPEMRYTQPLRPQAARRQAAESVNPDDIPF